MTECGRPTRKCQVLIIGGGMSGIGFAATLSRENIDDYLLLERAEALGGTWHHNTYPDCACDIPSALYQFAFRPNPDWSRIFASQDEIRRYLLDIAAEHDVLSHALLGTEMLGAAWDDQRRRWLVETNRGRIESAFLMVATGSLDAANMATIPGTERFAGRIFHSSRWPAGYVGAGERVAVIGTGASSIQITPALVRTADRVVVFQRTPSWVQPKPNLRHGPRLRGLFRRRPWTQRVLRCLEWAFGELLLASVFRPWMATLLVVLPKLNLLLGVRDRELRVALTPTYAMGCKRLLVSSAFYPAMSAPNAELVASAVTEIREHSVVAANGVEREVDSIVFATGFFYGVGPTAGLIHGRDGRSLAEVWGGNPRAYRGTSVSGFPNMALIWGPNTGTVSAAVSVEAQFGYLRQMLAAMREQHIEVLDVRAECEAAFKESVRRATRGSVHNAGGCVSFYLDERGENLLLWPGPMIDMWRRMKTFDLAAYASVPLGAGQSSAAVGETGYTL